MAPAATGDWTGRDNALAAWQDGVWAFYDPAPGWLVWLIDESALLVWNGASWIRTFAAGPGGGVTPSSLGDGSHDLVGVNGAAADATNRLSVRTPVALFDSVDAAQGGSGDCRIVVNKEASGDTASHLFQTGFSGRAEFGLTGTDDFQLKVSADGAAWIDAVTIDKSAGKVGVGTDAPAYILDVNHAADIWDGLHIGEAGVSGEGFEITHFGGPGSGTRIRQHGNLPIRFFTNGGERLRILGNGNVGIGGTNPLSTLHVSNGGIQCGNPTGGDRGFGAVSVEAVYDDNTLLTCYVFDQAIDGSIDEEKWDAKVPDRIIPAVALTDDDDGDDRDREERREIPAQVVRRAHEPMRKFVSRTATKYDPLTLEGYSRHWKEKRHLTSMPNETTYDANKGLAAGEWIQRLVETVEIHAVLIEELNQRTKKSLAGRQTERPA